MALETTSGLLWPGAGPFGGERLSAIDVLALAGENPDAIREGVRVGVRRLRSFGRSSRRSA